MTQFEFVRKWGWSRCRAADRGAVVRLRKKGKNGEKRQGVWSSGGKRKSPRSVKGGEEKKKKMEEREALNQSGLHPGLQWEQGLGVLGGRLESKNLGVWTKEEFDPSLGQQRSGRGQSLGTQWSSRPAGRAHEAPSLGWGLPVRAGVPGWVGSQGPVLPAPQPGSPKVSFPTLTRPTVLQCWALFALALDLAPVLRS